MSSFYSDIRSTGAWVLWVLVNQRFRGMLNYGLRFLIRGLGLVTYS